MYGNYLEPCPTCSGSGKRMGKMIGFDHPWRQTCFSCRGGGKVSWQEKVKIERSTYHQNAMKGRE